MYVNPLRKQQQNQAYQPQATGMAIAPPPPVPPTPAPMLQPPPNEIGEPADMDIKRQMMGLIQQPQAQTQGTPAPAQNAAVAPNTAPPPPPANAPPPASAPPPQINAYGTNATEAQIAETLAAGETPFSMNYTPPPAGVGGATGSTTPISYSWDGTGRPTFTSGPVPLEWQNNLTAGGGVAETEYAPPPPPAAPNAIPAGAKMVDPNDPNTWQAGFYTPDGRLIPEGGGYDPGSNMISPGTGVRTWQYDLENNPNLPTTQGWMDRWNNRDPNADPQDLNTPWGADNYYFANEGRNGADGGLTNGESVGERGYIRTEGDPYGEDAENQQRIMEELRAMINGGQGTSRWDSSGGPGIEDNIPPVTDGGGSIPTPMPDPGADPWRDAETQRTGVTDGGGSGVTPDPDGDVEQEMKDLIKPTFDSQFPDPDALFEQGADSLEARLERGRTDSTRRIREVMAQRGVLEGSPEYGALTDLEGELGVQRQEGLTQLNRERYGFALDARAQELQKYGIDTSLAYQYASLEQDAGFRDRALDLQKLGMNMDESYRYAAMAQDGKFRQAVLDMQKQGMTLDEAYRQAGLAWDKQRHGTDTGLAKEGLDIERQRLASQVQSMLYDNMIEWKDVPEWIKDIIVPDWRQKSQADLKAAVDAATAKARERAGQP